jgi:hypothetical protein
MDDRGTEINQMGSACDELSDRADALILSQFYPARRRSTSIEPILRLTAGLLIDAVRCFQRNFKARDAKRRGEFKEAEFWIFHDRGEGPFSFEDLCTALEVEPPLLRDLIVRWEKNRRCADKQQAGRSSGEGRRSTQSQRGRVLAGSKTARCLTVSTSRTSWSSAPCVQTNGNPGGNPPPHQQRDSRRRSKSGVTAGH